MDLFTGRYLGACIYVRTHVHIYLLWWYWEWLVSLDAESVSGAATYNMYSLEWIQSVPNHTLYKLPSHLGLRNSRGRTLQYIGPLKKLDNPKNSSNQANGLQGGERKYRHSFHHKYSYVGKEKITFWVGKLFADFFSQGILEIIQQIKSYTYPYSLLVLRS